MRILLLNQFYPPSLAPTGWLLADLARGLAERGHDVRVLTGAGRYQLEEAGRPPACERDRGVDIVRTWSPDLGKGRIWLRLADIAAYAAGVAARAAGRWAPDVVVATTSPPFLGLFALAYRLRWRSRVVLWSMDRYPAALAAFGWLSRDGLVFRCLEILERTILGSASSAIALDADMAFALEAAGARCVRVVPNWERVEDFPIDDGAATDLARHLGHQGRFLVLYSGNLGHDHDFETLLAAARRLAELPDVLFVFGGGGARHTELRAALAREGLANVRIRPFVAREERAALLRSAAVNVVTLREGVVSISTPSKTYGMLAAGRPILYVGPSESEVVRIVERERCGLAVRTGDADGVVAFIRELLADPALAAGMGERARRAFLERYEFRIAFKDLAAEIEAKA